MITSQELQINDLVHVYINNNGITDENNKVRYLTTSTIGFISSFGSIEEADAEDVYGIPLTVEILELNGFHYADDEYSAAYYKDDFDFELRDKIDTDGTVYFTMRIGTRTIDIGCVHELQHVLRMYGEEEVADNFKLS